MNATIAGQAKRHNARVAVLALALCVAVLIASECLGVSLLSLIAQDLGVTKGRAGQAILILGLFAVGTSLTIARMTPWIDRKRVQGALMALLVVDRRACGRPVAQPGVGCDAVALAGFATAASVGWAAGLARRHSEVSR